MRPSTCPSRHADPARSAWASRSPTRYTEPVARTAAPFSCSRAQSRAADQRLGRLGLARALLEAELAGQRLQRRGRQRSVARWRREPSSLAQRQQCGKHPGGILVLEHTEHQRQRATGKQLGQRLHQRGDRGWIVRAIEHRQRIVSDNLHTTRQPMCEIAASRMAARSKSIPHGCRYDSRRQPRQREVLTLERAARAHRHLGVGRSAAIRARRHAQRRRVRASSSTSGAAVSRVPAPSPRPGRRASRWRYRAAWVRASVCARDRRW